MRKGEEISIIIGETVEILFYYCASDDDVWLRGKCLPAILLHYYSIIPDVCNIIDTDDSLPSFLIPHCDIHYGVDWTFIDGDALLPVMILCIIIIVEGRWVCVCPTTLYPMIPYLEEIALYLYLTYLLLLLLFMYVYTWYPIWFHSTFIVILCIFGGRRYRYNLFIIHSVHFDHWRRKAPACNLIITCITPEILKVLTEWWCMYMKRREEEYVYSIYSILICMI